MRGGMRGWTISPRRRHRSESFGSDVDPSESVPGATLDTMTLDPTPTVERTACVWRDDIEPALHDYIRVPALSVAFDPAWERNGHLDRVVEDARRWIEDRPVTGLRCEVVRLPGRTPLLWFEVDPTHLDDTTDTVLLYGHLDKQPPMTGWRDGLGPWEPVVEGDRLYGRGGADDGYAAYASVAAIEAVQAGGGRHGRLVGMIECSEESGSPDLPAYVEHLAERIGTPTLVVCLDSFAGDYERLWTTTSLRGLLDVELTVEVLTEGVHSGSASGVVPDTFRIARSLLDRVEDATTGRILVPELHATVPPGRRAEIDAVADDLGAALTASYPYVAGAGPAIPANRPADQLRAKTWEPTLTVIGADGLPSVRDAGNVLRPSTTLALSFRLPPTVDACARVRRWSRCSPPIPRTARGCGPRCRAASRAGTRRRPPRGWRRPPRLRRPPRSARPLAASAKAGRSRSWACSAPGSPTRSSC